tara:strand:+ start:60139 stop:60399 length:261 start_codon:yes stop_codon:yes gene_type:complete
MIMHLVSRFVAEAIVFEVGSDSDNVITNTDEGIEVLVAPCELDMNAITEYVTIQHGGTQDAQDDINDAFSEVDLTSNLLVTFFWEE